MQIYNLFILIFLSIIQKYYCGGGDDDGGSSCKPQFPCSSCSNSPTNCSQCIVGTGRKSSPSCGCKDGYFQIGNNTNCDSCDNTKCGTCTNLNNCIINCDSSCQTCNTDGSCQTCGQNQKIQGGKCVCNTIIGNSNNFPTCDCQDGYYFNLGQNSCKTCDKARCATCSSQLICIISCHSSCQTCDNTGSCLSCAQNQIIQSGQCECQIGTGRSNIFPQCDCQNGFYQIGSLANCGKCDDTKCGTCRDDSETCITSCNSTCKTCNVDGSCKTCNQNQKIQGQQCVCITGIGRSNIFPQCQCINGYYQISNNSDCGQCDNKFCGTCKNNAQNCIKECNSSCKTCNIDGSCKTCEIYQEIISQNCQCITGIGRDNKVPCYCRDGYFQQGSNSDCSTCDDAFCGTCIDSSKKCIVTCDSTCKRCNIDGTCKLCFQNYYILNGKCVLYQQQQCINCLQQIKSNNICQCSKSQYLIINNDSNFICKNCQYPCIQCCSQNYCQLCINTLNRNPVPNCNCKIGYYNDNSTNICIKCHYKCKECSDFKTCLKDKCTDQNNRINDGQCLCKDGFFDDNQEFCKQCQYPCLYCTSINVCISCQNSGITNINCNCEKGYYADQNTLQCQKCDIQCEQCFSQPNNCISCNQMLQNNKNKYNRLYSLKNKCGCQKGFYSLNNTLECKICQYPCQECTSIKVCVPKKCISNKFRFPNCECYAGYFDNGSFCEKK